MRFMESNICEGHGTEFLVVVDELERSSLIDLCRKAEASVRDIDLSRKTSQGL